MAFGSYRGAIVDQYGNAISGVTVTVYLEGTLTPATLASDRAETVLVNPFTNESDGSYEFWASTTAAYDIVFSKSGVTFDNTDFTDIDVTGALPDNSVTGAKIVDLSITDIKIAASGITTRSKLPVALAYEDEANVFTDNQTITHATDPKLTITDTTSSVTLVLMSDNLLGRVGTTSNHDFRIQAGGVERALARATIISNTVFEFRGDVVVRVTGGASPVGLKLGDSGVYSFIRPGFGRDTGDFILYSSSGIAAMTIDSAGQVAIPNFVGFSDIGAKVYRSTPITGLSLGTFVTVLFDGESYDSGPCHDTSVNTSRLTAPITGQYHFTAVFGRKSQSAGPGGGLSSESAHIRFRKNGSSNLTRSGGVMIGNDGEISGIVHSEELFLSAGEYVEVQVMAYGDQASSDLFSSSPVAYCLASIRLVGT